MQHLRLLSSLLPSMHANIISGSENLPFHSFHLFTHLLDGPDLPPTPAPFSALPCPLPLTALLPCTLDILHVAPLPLITSFFRHQGLCTRAGRKGKLEGKWLSTSHFENNEEGHAHGVCLRAGGERVSTCSRCVSLSPLKLSDRPRMRPPPSISPRAPGLWGGINNNLNAGPRDG